ncbi:helix-turn-helix transcriptional regulator [Rosenbergiella australiborealis]|uniref:helix-turn-helix transcriptional regulator n=1 Tax=Rosenbergiella australiborealis TaxID=1544696 RepID=UPI001F4E3C08|nr:LuxR C-terminal-related transcriptional regulator [Rosenbergiella australiborealis]
MDVLVIRVIGEDAYFKLGILSLVHQHWEGKTNQICIATDDMPYFDLCFDFHEEVVVISTSLLTRRCSSLIFSSQRWGDIYIPFNCRRYRLIQIEKKLAKILEIASCKMINEADLSFLITNGEIKGYQQLSQSEFLIMTFIGQGLDCHCISKKINRSIKTIRTHYRSASRKLGFDNHADFFRFAKYISKNNQGVINTLCL